MHNIYIYIYRRDTRFQILDRRGIVNPYLTYPLHSIIDRIKNDKFFFFMTKKKKNSNSIRLNKIKNSIDYAMFSV
jgi:hypothetical protein